LSHWRRRSCFRPCAAPLLDQSFQASDLDRYIVQANQRGVHSTRIDFLAPLPSMDQQPEIAGCTVLLAAVPEQLHVEPSLVEGRLSPLPEDLELTIESVEQLCHV
jgi:hypothetical protein